MSGDPLSEDFDALIESGLARFEQESPHDNFMALMAYIDHPPVPDPVEVEVQLESTEKAVERPKRRRTQRDKERRWARQLGKWRRPPQLERSQFQQGMVYETYASFLYDVKSSPTTLPDEILSKTALKAFPKKYTSPVEVPRTVQKELSRYRFFYNRNIVYRSAFGHALFIVSKRAAEKGHILTDFDGHGGRREVFHRNRTTGDIHYLGEFRLVKSVAFPYSRRECGNFPEISSASVPPARGNVSPPSVFYILQFMRYNERIVEAFLKV